MRRFESKPSTQSYSGSPTSEHAILCAYSAGGKSMIDVFAVSLTVAVSW